MARWAVPQMSAAELCSRVMLDGLHRRVGLLIIEEHIAVGHMLDLVARETSFPRERAQVAQRGLTSLFAIFKESKVLTVAGMTNWLVDIGFASATAVQLSVLDGWWVGLAVATGAPLLIADPDLYRRLEGLQDQIPQFTGSLALRLNLRWIGAY
jgi:hypothetical protein